MMFHWQNLNEKGSAWRAGRAWWHFSRRTLRFEWSHLKNPRVCLEVIEAGGDGDELGLNLALLIGSWWVSLSHCRTHAADTAFGVRTGFSLWGDWLRFFWRHNSDTGKLIGLEWSVMILDVLLGRRIYRAGQPQRSTIYVQMPERTYVGECSIQADSWKRARWFRDMIWRAHVEMIAGEQIPVPGKGENSWDCDDDAIYGSTFPCRTAEDAAEHMRADALRTRAKYGGRAWRPSQQ